MVWVSVRLEKPTLVSSVNLCGTWSSHQANYGCNFYQTNTLGGWISFKQLFIQTALHLGPLLFVLKIFSNRVILGARVQALLPFGSAIGALKVLSVIMFLSSTSMTFTLPLKMFSPLMAPMLRIFTLIFHLKLWTSSTPPTFDSMMLLKILLFGQKTKTVTIQPKAVTTGFSLSKSRLMTTYPISLGPGCGGYKHRKKNKFLIWLICHNVVPPP